MYDDTVFCVKNVDEAEARYILNKGKYKLPANKRVERIRDFNNYKKVAQPYLNTAVQELDAYVFVHYTSFNYEGDEHLAVYDKNKRDFYSVGTEDAPGFKNDIDGAGLFIPYRIYDDCRMISYYNAIDFKEEYKDAINNPSVSASFRDLYNETSEEDNLMIQIVHLKKGRSNLALVKE